MKAAVIFPHQLFAHNPILASAERIYLIEEPLFFTQYKFHKQKLTLHRASMKYYAEMLSKRGFKTSYIEFSRLEKTKDIADILARDGITKAAYCDPTDDWLGRRFQTSCEEAGIGLEMHDSPMFFNSRQSIIKSFPPKKHYSLTDFYRKERLRLGILLDDEGKPLGGKWTFDTENRKRLPKGLYLKPISFTKENKFVEEAREYIKQNFAGNYGALDEFIYPVSHADASLWLDEFLQERFALFGDYEDAIARDEDFIFHSLLTPMMNTGLLTPREVIDRALSYAAENEIPLNSLEGFIRQIIGWREFMRAIYESIGAKQRTSNFWGHTRKLPASFWNGSTGIGPLDNTIKRILKYGYCHHIERLMIIGNFMLLAEIAPDDAYLWFMELFIDSYDWVMVPNIYAMSQYADGGMITTKPYISGSNYIKKMSDYGSGEWCEIWDGLYWRFIAKHLDFFAKNPRLSIMQLALNKMDAARKQRLFATADNFLERNF